MLDWHPPPTAHRARRTAIPARSLHRLLTGMLLYLVSVSTAPAGLSRAVSFPPVLATADPGMSRSSTVSRTGRPTWSIPSALSEFPQSLFDAVCPSSPGENYPG